MAQNSRSTKLIYDYIYLDDEKISYLSSQVFEHGLLTGASLSDGKVSKNSTVTKGTANATGEGNLDKSVLSVLLGSAKVGGGTSLGLDYTVGSDLNSGLVHSYDTKFLAARNLLNKLDEDGYINKGMNNIQPCSLVLLKGDLNILDFNLVEILFAHGDKKVTEFEKYTKPEALKVIREQEGKLKQLKNKKNQSEYKELLEALLELKKSFNELEVSMSENKIAMEKAKLAISSAMKDKIRLRMMVEDKIFSSLISAENVKLNLENHAIQAGEQIVGEAFCLALIERLPILLSQEHEQPKIEEIEPNSKFEYLKTALGEVQGLLELNDSDYVITPIIVFRKISIASLQ